jgi:NADP-dependent 3-hydroxy acid dehydrogenase YdfG
LQTLAEDIQRQGGKAIALATVVSDRAQVARLVDAAVQAHGRIDAMLNNAGLMPHSPLERLKVDDRERMIDVNLKGVLYGIAAALPYMQRQKAWHFINVSSVNAVFAATGTRVRHRPLKETEPGRSLIGLVAFDEARQRGNS